MRRAATTNQDVLSEATRRANDAPRCSQCGERLVRERDTGRLKRARDLCVDCAFDAIPFTD